MYTTYSHFVSVIMTNQDDFNLDWWLTLNVTEFWRITHMVAPETIRIFEFSMALLIAKTTFKNISKLYL